MRKLFKSLRNFLRTMEQLFETFKKLGFLQCHYCHKELEEKKWFSEWDHHHPDDNHYKSIVCGHCQHKTWLRVDFPGSGHDQVFKKQESSLESAVKTIKC